MRRTDYLVDVLSTASIEAPGESYVDLQRMVLGREVETAIFQHPPSTITFPPIELGQEAVLDFACGIKEAAWPRIKSEVRFTMSIELNGEREHVFETKLNPRSSADDRRWQHRSLNLSRFAGERIRLVLRTSVARGRSSEYAWAGWANPRIVHTVQARESIARRDNHPHIFLLTADTLSARYLACYGHAEAQTPHLDELAADGVLFEEAWSQSCMTLGSYASILTGRYTHEHGISREWQPFPASLLSLPVALEAHGYHTLFAASSSELADRASSLGKVFRELIPSLGNPMQDGAVTTRRFIRWLDERPERPCFCWVHYFDIHPPALPPEPFRKMYYTADPTEREYLPENVTEIRGVESLLLLRASMPLLERGVPISEVADVLDDTAAVLKGQSGLRPDLAEHMLNLGARATAGRSAAQFGEWLKDVTTEMRRGHVSAQLIKWLKDVMRLFESTEADLVSWLNGVVDFRFPLSMYMGTVSYFDSNVGALVSYLKEHDLYDQSLIVVTAPHGEMLDWPPLPYHHFLLNPDTLHVPLIVKLPKQANVQKKGMRIGGVFDLIDIFPTLLDIQGLQHSFKLSGVSRWHEIQRGASIPPHDSFASGMHLMAQSVYRPPYLLVREKPNAEMQTFHALLSGAREVVYDVRRRKTFVTNQPEVIEGLRASLEAWQRSSNADGRRGVAYVGSKR